MANSSVCSVYIWVGFSSFPRTKALVLPIALEKNVGIQFACFGNVNTRAFVVTEAGLLVPEGLVAVDGGCEVPLPP